MDSSSVSLKQTQKTPFPGNGPHPTAGRRASNKIPDRRRSKLAKRLGPKPTGAPRTASPSSCRLPPAQVNQAVDLLPRSASSRQRSQNARGRERNLAETGSSGIEDCVADSGRGNGDRTLTRAQLRHIQRVE